VALEVLAPLVALIKERRSTMKTLVLPGNTDWPVADSDPSNQDAFFVFTGLTRGDAHLPSNLWKSFETDDTIISITHGHALKPAYWPYQRPLNMDDGMKVWDTLNHPDQRFLDLISATSGSHRKDYLKAVAVGSVVKLFPRSFRQKANHLLGQKFTREYEEYYGELLRIGAEQTRKKVLGIMGHTHVAGIRSYNGIHIVNTGTTGAKPNPLQRLSDPSAHMAMVDTEQGTYQLLQTFNAARPTGKPDQVGEGDFADL
jgi:hypothetical protein